MDKRTADLAIFSPLMLVTTGVAMLLDDVEQHANPDDHIEPDGAVFEMMLGCVTCLIGGSLRARLGEDHDRQNTERAMYLAFIFGGIPIFVWRLCLIFRRHHTYREVMVRTMNLNGSQSTHEKVALQGGSSAHNVRTVRDRR